MHEKKTGRKIDREFIGFTLISGLISFGYNVVMTVIPLRMSDHGQSYGRIGSAMSAVAIGLMVIKLVIGHLSDILGTDEDVIYRDIENEVERKLLLKAINKLTDREKTIINLRFGLNTSDGQEMTQKEVATLLGISQSYISRLEKKIMKRLKREMVKE